MLISIESFLSHSTDSGGGGEKKQLPACPRSHSDGPEIYASRALLLVGAKTEPRTFSVKSYLSR